MRLCSAQNSRGPASADGRDGKQNRGDKGREHGALLVNAGRQLVTQSFSWHFAIRNRHAMKAFLCAIASICLVSSASHAIQLGDPAPALAISKWVKDRPVDLAA